MLPIIYFLPLTTVCGMGGDIRFCGQKQTLIRFSSVLAANSKATGMYMFSSLLDLSSVLAANSKATGMYKDHL